MPVSTAQLSVGAGAAVELTPVMVGDAVPGFVMRVAPTVADVFVGGAGVTAGTGYKVTAGTVLELPLEPGERLYGITASGTATVYVLRAGV